MCHGIDLLPVRSGRARVSRDLNDWFTCPAFWNAVMPSFRLCHVPQLKRMVAMVTVEAGDLGGDKDGGNRK